MLVLVISLSGYSFKMKHIRRPMPLQPITIELTVKEATLLCHLMGDMSNTNIHDSVGSAHKEEVDVMCDVTEELYELLSDGGYD